MAETLLHNGYIPLCFPLLAFLVIGLWLNRKSDKASGLLALVLAGLTALTGVITAWSYVQNVLKQPELFPSKSIIAGQVDWLNFTPTLTARMGILLDPISVMMLVVIVIIGFLVTWYSLGYMRGDKGFGRFFALLSLFVFAMLGLVLSDNIFQMFVFWELVGVSSYSLIGFWYHKPSAVAASKKAFIVTRLADAFFLLGIVLIGFYANSFDFQVLNSPETAAHLRGIDSIFGMDLLTVATLLIFTGAWGKSAMFPLHIWLPDAMEGPTPVSSIIHSATMVVAGVFLTARMFPLFAASNVTLMVVGVVGAFTALFAAVIAITQTDIKRILAFSTLSQLGYMMFSLGAAKTAHHGGAIEALGFSASMFHIFTHAFFKCLLFLAAGAVIHAVHSNEIHDMGRLRKSMPWTYRAVLIACLAIGGIFPFAGFWSKDEILLAALHAGHPIIFFTGLVVGGITAFYMFRFFFLIFHGEPRGDHHDIHEDPLMTAPILILAVPSVVIGFMAKDFFIHYITPPVAPEMLAPHQGHSMVLPFIASFTGLAGVSGAWYLYGRGDTTLVHDLRQRFGAMYEILVDKFYIDELYLLITHQVIFRFVAAPIKWFDRAVVDGAMDLTGMLLQVGGKGVRFMQNGLITRYLGLTLLGIAFVYFLG